MAGFGDGQTVVSVRVSRKHESAITCISVILYRSYQCCLFQGFSALCLASEALTLRSGVYADADRQMIPLGAVPTITAPDANATSVRRQWQRLQHLLFLCNVARCINVPSYSNPECQPGTEHIRSVPLSGETAWDQQSGQRRATNGNKFRYDDA